MITVKAYMYPNTVEIQVFDPSIFTLRNRVVYSRTIKVYQGVDNPIQIITKNQDQKAVNLTGYIMQADIQDPVNQVTVNSYAVVYSDISKGLASFVLDKETLNSLEQRFYQLTFKLIQQGTNHESPLYIDDNYGVPLDLQVLPAFYSTVLPAPSVDNSIIDGGIL